MGMAYRKRLGERTFQTTLDERGISSSSVSRMSRGLHGEHWSVRVDENIGCDQMPPGAMRKATLGL